MEKEPTAIINICYNLPMKKRNNTRLITYSTITFLIMLTIFILSSMEADESSVLSDSTYETIISLWGNHMSDALKLLIDEYIRKAAHFLIYTLLGSFIYLTVIEWKQSKLPAKLMAEYSLIVSIAYAISDELHQRFVPGRSCEWRDVCIDGLGAALGIGIISSIRYLKDKHASG